MADTQNTQIGKNFETLSAMQVRNKHLTVAVSQFSYKEGGGRGLKWLWGLNCVIPRICSCSSQLKRLTNTLDSFPNTVVICASLRCEATHSSVYGCDSVGQRWVGISSWTQCVDCLLVAAVAIYYATTFNTKKTRWNEATLLSELLICPGWTLLCLKRKKVLQNYISLNHVFLASRFHTVPFTHQNRFPPNRVWTPQT